MLCNRKISKFEIEMWKTRCTQEESNNNTNKTLRTELCMSVKCIYVYIARARPKQGKNENSKVVSNSWTFVNKKHRRRKKHIEKERKCQIFPCDFFHLRFCPSLSISSFCFDSLIFVNSTKRDKLSTTNAYIFEFFFNVLANEFL